MVVLFALFGALVGGLVLGLLFRGMVLFGDQRQLDIMAQQMVTEHRLSALNRNTLSEMRRVASERFNGRG